MNSDAEYVENLEKIIKEERTHVRGLLIDLIDVFQDALNVISELKNSLEALRDELLKQEKHEQSKKNI